MNKLSFCLLVLGILFPALSASAATNAFEKEILAFETRDRTNPPPQNANLFIGSSSIRMWTTLTKDFPNHKVINRGFGGSKIADATWFADRIVVPYKPAKIFLYAGSNDLAGGKKPAEVFSDFKAFVTKVRSTLPDVEIAFISIAPNVKRWNIVDQFKETNVLIKDYIAQAQKMEYIDIFDPMLGPDKGPRPEILIADGLHMNAKGYAIWTPIIEPHLK
jgi:lysophospholipase L1-like esterase